MYIAGQSATCLPPLLQPHLEVELRSVSLAGSPIHLSSCACPWTTRKGDVHSPKCSQSFLTQCPPCTSSQHPQGRCPDVRILWGHKSQLYPFFLTHWVPVVPRVEHSGSNSLPGTSFSSRDHEGISGTILNNRSFIKCNSFANPCNLTWKSKTNID